MSRLIPILVVFLLFIAGGVLWMVASDDPEPDAGLLQVDSGPPLPQSRVADRDNPNETLRTLTEMQERMQKALQEQTEKSQSSLDAAKNENTILRDELQQLREEFKHTLDQQIQKITDANAKLGSDDIPSGLGYDDFDYPMSPPSGTAPSTVITPAPPKDQYVSVTPVGMNLGTDTASDANNASGGLLDKTSAIFDQATDVLTPDALENKRKRGSQKNSEADIPAFTINNLATLVTNATMTALIGIVPVNNNIVDPFRFKLITGAENLAASGLRLPPGIVEIKWGGFSVGNREMSCVRGWVDTVTLVFRDGTISTTTTRKNNSNDTKSTKTLGYISDPWGKPCIRGKYIANTDQYLKDRAFMAALAAASDASAAAETSSIVSNDSFVNSITGDKGDYFLGKAASGLSSEILQYFRDRMAGAFDVVFIHTGEPLSIHVEDEIKFDYNPKGRKIDHGFNLQQATSHYQLD